MPIDLARFNGITHGILAGAIEVHRTLGPGLLESISLQCLKRELTLRGHRFVSEFAVPVVYKGTKLEAAYRIDLVVDDCVVVEVKAVPTMLPLHQAQTLTYLRLSSCPVGLLINFNVPRLMDGVKRLVNGEAGDGRPRSQEKT
jgi:GxxExxY protein